MLVISQALYTQAQLNYYESAPNGNFENVAFLGKRVTVVNPDFLIGSDDVVAFDPYYYLTIFKTQSVEHFTSFELTTNKYYDLVETACAGNLRQYNKAVYTTITAAS